MKHHAKSAPSAQPPRRSWERGAERWVLAGLAAFALVTAALMAWLRWAPLSGAIAANGLVKVDTNRKTVQHRDGGIVHEILVREGDHVALGQPLVVLDDARVDAGFDLARSQLDAQRLRAARLAAERELAPAWAVPPALQPRRDEPRLGEALARESALFAARRTAYESQGRLIREQVNEVQREIAARQREHAAATEALTHMRTMKYARTNCC